MSKGGQMAIVVQNMAEFKQLINENTCVVDFTATWCGPCKMIAPKFEELAGQYTNVKFLKVDVDELDDVAQEYGVSAMPTFKVFKDGKIVEEMVGASKEKLEAMVQKVSQ